MNEDLIKLIGDVETIIWRNSDHINKLESRDFSHTAKEIVEYLYSNYSPQKPTIIHEQSFEIKTTGYPYDIKDDPSEGLSDLLEDNDN